MPCSTYPNWRRFFLSLSLRMCHTQFSGAAFSLLLLLLLPKLYYLRSKCMEEGGNSKLFLKGIVYPLAFNLWRTKTSSLSLSLSLSLSPFWSNFPLWYGPNSPRALYVASSAQFSSWAWRVGWKKGVRKVPASWSKMYLPKDLKIWLEILSV